MRNRQIIKLVAMVIVLQLTAQIRGTPYAGATATRSLSDSETIRLNLGSQDPTLDPTLALDYPSHFVVRQLFAGLVRADEASGAIIPDLATSWQVSANADVYTFSLRNDATWSDGSAMTAEDVFYSLTRAIKVETGAPWGYLLRVIDGVDAYRNGEIDWETFLADGGITVLDPRHIRIALREPASHFLHILTHPIALTVPEQAINAHGNSWTEPGNIVTNGPYTVASWLHGQALTLQKDPAHFNAANHEIAQVTFFMESDDVAWARFLLGQLDSTVVPADQWHAYQNDAEVGHMLRPAVRHCTTFFGFNTALPPFDDVRIRRAFMASLDREGLADVPLADVWRAAHTLTPPTVFGYDAAVGIPYDPDQARTWLAEAGYPGGLGLPAVSFVYYDGAENGAASQFASENWSAELGAIVFPLGVTFGDLIDLLENDPPQLWSLRWCSDYANAHNFLYDFVEAHSDYFGAWNNSAYSNLIEAATQSPDTADQALFFRLAEQRLIETDAVLLPVFHAINGHATRPYLQRTYGNGGISSAIADWKIGWQTYLPVAID